MRDEISVTACWSGNPADAAAALRPYELLGRPVKRTVETMRFVDLQRRHDELLPFGRRYFTKGGYLPGLTHEAISALQTAAALLPNATSEIYLIQPGGAIGDLDDAATAFTGRHAEFFWLAQAIWDDPVADDANVRWGRRASGFLDACSSSGNYVNEQSEFGRNGVEKAYGGEKYRRLAKLKARYDPDNLFRLNQNIPPQTWEAQRPSR